jgi:hypothetical protein
VCSGSLSIQAHSVLTLNLKLRVDVHAVTDIGEDVSDESVGTAHGRVDLGSDTDESTRDGEPEVVVLGKKGDDLGDNRLAVELSVLLLSDDSRTNLNELLELWRGRE